MFEQRMKEIENDMVPFGYIDDGSADYEDVLGPDRTVWSVDENFKVDGGY